MTQLPNHEDLPVRSNNDVLDYARVLLKMYGIAGEIEDFSSITLAIEEKTGKKYDPFMISYGLFNYSMSEWSHIDTYPTADELLSVVHHLVNNKQKMVDIY